MLSLILFLSLTITRRFFVISENTINKQRIVDEYELTESEKYEAGKKFDIIVKYKDESTKKLILESSVKVNADLKEHNIMSVRVNSNQYEFLNTNEGIENIEFEEVIYLDLPERNTVRNEILESQETIPYGILQVLEDDLNFFESLGTPAGRVKVCVADTGYDVNHIDLPKPFDVIGVNRYFTTESWDEDYEGHGTHIAGTIAALGNNNKGITSLIPNNQNGKFQLVITKAFQTINEETKGSKMSIIAAISDCVSVGATVVNLSLGSPSYMSVLEETIHNYYENEDILFIAAAGNNGNSNYRFPASFPDVMSVAGVNERKEKYQKSHFNDQVEICAPAVRVLSTVPKGGYEKQNGTSMAVAHVSAVAGILRMHFPQCKNYEIRNAIIRSAEDLGPTGCDNNFGHGFVQAKRAYNFLCQGNCGVGAVIESKGGCEQAPAIASSSFFFDACPTLSPTVPTSNSLSATLTLSHSYIPTSPIISDRPTTTPIPTKEFTIDWVKTKKEINNFAFVDMSDDGKVVATVTTSTGGNCREKGYIKVFQESKGKWNTLGTPIENMKKCDTFQYAYFGRTVALSGDGRVVAAGYHSTDSRTLSETVCIYEFNDNIEGKWSMRGESCIKTKGDMPDSRTKSLSLSYSGKVVCFYVPSKKRFHIYKFDKEKNKWVEFGNTKYIFYYFINPPLPTSISLELLNDGKTIATAMSNWNKQEINIYNYDDESDYWVRIRASYITNFYASLHTSVSLSNDGRTLAYFYANPQKISIKSNKFLFPENDWSNAVKTLTFKNLDPSKVFLSLSGDGNTVAIIIEDFCNIYTFDADLNEWVLAKRETNIGTTAVVSISHNGNSFAISSYGVPGFVSGELNIFEIESEIY